MVKILVIESEEGEGILNEIVDFLSSRVQCRGTNCSDIISSPGILTFPDLDIHIHEQTVYKDGKLVSMSHHEFFTLLYLAQHPGWVFTKEQIYDAVYGDEKIVDIDNAVYCLVRSIRKKLKNEYIQTVRGVGYKFMIPEE